MKLTTHRNLEYKSRRFRDQISHAVFSQPAPVKIYDKNGKLVKTITNFRKEHDHYEIID